ncbi:RecX family transcriptional regulator [Acinetobacter sp. ANC 5054]|uniref:regulatory protein RecX n=1 Tax=Acinetobacter sp. ANC 5054 TaxID=1977877 RepID=UPI000A35AB44|nr:regulatory protein RecX [Acinetobacter sp. ANC 5054]OTG82647.1 RecX family transcriptional regulator [Acinetobacter sp. ANC 5054]
MTKDYFPLLLDYEALKQQFAEDEDQIPANPTSSQSLNTDALHFDANGKDINTEKKPGLTGTRLRSYAFAVLTRKEYSKADLIEKLALYADSRDEVIQLVEELARENYQSDQRVAELMLSSQKRKGKGPNRIKLALKNKKINSELIQDELKETDWVAQAYSLKVKKFGKEVERDPKLKAKQIRFLQYRGFDLDTIFKVIARKDLNDE